MYIVERRLIFPYLKLTFIVIFAHLKIVFDILYSHYITVYDIICTLIVQLLDSQVYKLFNREYKFYFLGKTHNNNFNYWLSYHNNSNYGFFFHSPKEEVSFQYDVM